MANEVSKIKLPNDTTEYPLQDDQAIASITRSGTTFTATRRDGTSFTFTQQDNNTTYTFATGDNNGQIKVTPSGGTAQNVSVKGLGAAAYKGTTTSVTSGSSDLVTSGAVYTAIDNLPSPMVFKGTLGTNGTITTLPTASSANEGFVYKCITAGTYASQEAKVGDVFVSNTTEWVLIPAGDTDTDTWRNIKVNGTQKLGNGISTGAVDFISGNHVSLSFNATGNKLTVAHSDTSSQASVTNSGRTYIQSIGLDGDGHVTSLTSAIETVVNTDRYVNSAAFANDTSGVKMTLTRAGSDTATVTGIIPKVSSSTAGVAPKGATVSSQSQSTKFLREDGSWATPSYTTNTNTTYTIGTSGDNITLTPSSGSAQSITAPYATNAGSATKATQDGSGNTITSTYVKKSGDTMTGTLTLYKEGTTNDNYPTELKFQNKDTTMGKTSNGYIRAYDGGESGANIVINPAGNIFIGSGEAAQHHYDLYTHSTSENFFATADSNMYLQANGQTIANRVGISITSGHALIPVKADVGVNNVGSIGTSSYRWNEIHSRSIYSTRENQLITGSGTAAQDKGAGVSPRYFPAKWTFNTGLTVADGDVFTIKIPVAGHSYGVYMSVNNGSNYYPIVLNGTGRLTTHYPVNTYITVVFESSGSATSIYPVGGGDATTTVTGGAWRVINYYDANSAVTQTATTTDANYEVLFSVTADNTTRTEGARKSNALIFNPTEGLKVGSSSQSAFPSVGIQVHDVRSVNFTPNVIQKGVNFFFSDNTMPNSNWWAGLHIKGWEGSYAAWEIVGSAHNNDSRTTPLYVRSSNQASTWGSWRKIYDTSNPPSKSDIGLGNVENKSSATIRGELTSANVTNALGYTPPTSDTNTHRPIQMNGTEILGNNTTALNLKAGSNVTLSHSSGTVTIAATNTTYGVVSKTANGLCPQLPNETTTTKYLRQDGTWVAPPNTNTHRPIQVDGTEILGNNTTALNLVAGTNVSLSNDGGAITITATDTNNAVAITNTNPTTGTWYYPIWHSSTSATSTGLKANDGFRHYSLQGTTSAAGRTILSLGNGTATGAAGNKYGTIRLYAEKTGYADIVSIASATSGTIHTLPATGGTILNTGTTSFTRSLSSGTKIGTIKINGTSTDLYCQTNTNDEVTQTIDNSTNSDFRLLMSATSDDTTLTEGAKKTTGLRYNPYYQRLQLLADSSSREDVFEVLYKDPEIAGYIVSARIDADGSATFRGLSLGGNIIPGNTYSIGTESSKWGDLYVTTIMGGTCVNTQYKDNTTNTTGFVMHGRTNGNKYSCIWQNSKLNFYVDTTNVGNISDRQLKSEIDEIDPRLMEAIAECKIYQYKAFNRDGLISVGIMAQDLVEKCEEKGVRPENYELLTKMNFIQGDDTLYYSVDYNQYATFMIDYLQKKVKELEEKIK